MNKIRLAFYIAATIYAVWFFAGSSSQSEQFKVISQARDVLKGQGLGWVRYVIVESPEGIRYECFYFEDNYAGSLDCDRLP